MTKFDHDLYIDTLCENQPRKCASKPDGRGRRAAHHKKYPPIIVVLVLFVVRVFHFDQANIQTQNGIVLIILRRKSGRFLFLCHQGHLFRFVFLVENTSAG